MRWLLAIWVYLVAAAAVIVGTFVAFVPYGSLLGGMILILAGIGLAVGFSLYLVESRPRRLASYASESPIHAPLPAPSQTRRSVSSRAAAAPAHSEV